MATSANWAEAIRKLNTQIDAAESTCTQSFVQLRAALAELAANSTAQISARFMNARPAYRVMSTSTRPPDDTDGAARPDVAGIKGSAENSCAYIDWLQYGALKRCRKRSFRYAKSILKRKSSRFYDLVIDEFEYVIRFRSPAGELYAISIRDLRPMQRGMLWLILTKAGEGIAQRDIKTRFRPQTTLKKNALYQYRRSVKQLLVQLIEDSSLLELMIVRSKGGICFVPKTGWSFCWIRRTLNAEESVLLHGVGSYGQET